MKEEKSQKMNLEHERKIVALQERVERLENLCYSAKEVLNLEEASSFLGIAKSTLYKLTGSNSVPYFKPAGKLIFFEKQALLNWVRGAKAMSEEELKSECEHRRIASQRITIAAIRVLDSREQGRLQDVLDHIAYDRDYHMPERRQGVHL